ncbi:thymidine kinase [soil metagenome]
MTTSKMPKCNQHALQGSLEVICGPMFSGKSEELIRRLRRAKIAQQSVIIFKPQIDNRYGLEYVVSHDGNKLDAKPLTNVEDIIAITADHNATVIGLDETQFFASEIVSVICRLINDNKRVIVAGLDRDFRGAPFGCMPLLLAIADKVTKLQAICTQCGHDAHFTQRLVNGNPARFDDPIIMLGAQEAYQARCRGCYAIDKSFSC